MFAHLSVGSPNFEERVLRRDGAWTVLHRHAAAGQDGVQAGADIGGLVAGGQDDRQRWLGGGIGCGGHVGIIAGD